MGNRFHYQLPRSLKQPIEQSNPDQDPSDSRRLAPQLSQLFIIFNNHYRGQAPANALELLARLSGGKVSVPPPLLNAYPRLEAISASK